MPDLLLLLLDVLVCYRLTRLIVKDSLLQEARWWILRRWPNTGTTFPDNIVIERWKSGDEQWGTVDGTETQTFLSVDDDGKEEWLPAHTYKLTELIECVYCASVWIAFGVMAFNPWHGWLMYLGTSLAVAGVVALIFSRLDTD